MTDLIVLEGRNTNPLKCKKRNPSYALKRCLGGIYKNYFKGQTLLTVEMQDDIAYTLNKFVREELEVHPSTSANRAYYEDRDGVKYAFIKYGYHSSTANAFELIEIFMNDFIQYFKDLDYKPDLLLFRMPIRFCVNNSYLGGNDIDLINHTRTITPEVRLTTRCIPAPADMDIEALNKAIYETT